MDAKRKAEILAHAAKVFTVLAQVPMLFDEEARKAGNLVWSFNKEAACHTPEEERLWDEAFHGQMPLKSCDPLLEGKGNLKTKNKA